ncbi:MAG TPA: L-seryl-tRNA(Sec) selenium transferase [Burkholderiales bacterium]|nr:L-seryl-tRNA(Sec) selenium transferase [Burkholderiales bacterium]
MSLASLPSVDRLLRTAPVRACVERLGHDFVADEIRGLLAGYRGERVSPPEDRIVAALLERIERAHQPSLRPVFNLTGTVLHTNLGRALYPEEAAQAASEASTRPCTLEFDLGGGRRGERDAHVEALACRLTGAEAATVVNNNAAGVLLALNTLAKGREVLVSRGELVEIGGSFRIPEIIESAGCRLREVGTTNRTHLRDYEGAIDGSTAALLKVHTSNYAVVGFVASPAEAELARVAHARDLPYVCDLGSGSLVDLAQWGLPREPTPRQALAAGADLVTFSGDKLLGGPQAGFVAGRKDLVERVRKNPLKRALRLDKARLAALEAVLRLYLDPDRLAERLPTLRLLARTQEEIRTVALRTLSRLQQYLGNSATAEVADCMSQVGSGSLPVDRLPSAGLRIVTEGSLEALAARLRALPIPVIGRIHDGALWLDLRCLEDEAAFMKNLE